MVGCSSVLTLVTESLLLQVWSLVLQLHIYQTPLDLGLLQHLPLDQDDLRLPSYPCPPPPSLMQTAPAPFILQEASLSSKPMHAELVVVITFTQFGFINRPSQAHEPNNIPFPIFYMSYIFSNLLYRLVIYVPSSRQVSLHTRSQLPVNIAKIQPVR